MTEDQAVLGFKDRRSLDHVAEWPKGHAPEQVLTSLKLFVRIRVCRVWSVCEENDAARQ
jgi:hypothetical protein